MQRLIHQTLVITSFSGYIVYAIVIVYIIVNVESRESHHIL